MFKRTIALLIVVSALLALALPALAQAQTGSIANASRVNLRAGAGAGFGVVTVLSFGQQFTIIGRNADNSWVQVQTANGTTGWVNARYVAAGSVPSVPVTQPTGSLNAVVITDYLNVRSGPGANFGAVARLASGQTMNLVGRNADATWVQMSIPNGAAGWVSARYIAASVVVGNLPVTSNTGVTPTFPQPVPAGGQTGTVTAYDLNVRYGAGVQFGVFTRLGYGEGVSLVGRSGDAGWLLVQLADGRTGWVNTGFIRTTYPVVNLPVRG